MTNTADKLLQEAGATITESVGVGIGDLLARQEAGAGADPAAPARRRNRAAALLPLEMIDPDPDQPRKAFKQEEIEVLSKSLARHGQLQAIRVSFDQGTGRYRIISGERRWRAGRLAGLSEIAAEVVEKELSKEQVLEDQLVENCLREALDPIETAQAYKRLMDFNGWGGQVLAEALGLSHASVSRSLRLLGLAPDLQEKVADGRLPAGVAYEIALADEGRRSILAAAYESGRLPSRQAVRKALRKTARRGKAHPEAVPERAALEIGSVRVTVEWSGAERPSTAGLAQALAGLARRAEEARGSGLDWEDALRSLGPVEE